MDTLRIHPHHPQWPRGLSELRHPPTFLEMVGEWPTRVATLAIVGTRHPSTDAADIAYRIAKDLAGAGVLIVSGGAYGIDAAAHEGALDGGGMTVAILGSPIDPPYPRDHELLFARIALRGAVVSECQAGGTVHPANFLKRNRLIAACADAVLVVQAPLKSGALSTAAHARALGRPLFACPWSPLDVQGQGTVRLLVEGHAKAIRDAQDLAEPLSLPSTAKPVKPRRSPRSGTQEALPLALPFPEPAATAEGLCANLLSILSREPIHPDQLAQTLGVPIQRLQPALLELVLNGDAEPFGGGYRRSRGA